MALLIYSTLFRLLLPFLALRLLLRSRKAPAYRQRMLERLGFGPAMEGRPLWIHAVSVGEVIAISPLIERLLYLYPELPLLVTTMTPTGAEQLISRFGSRVAHCYVPWDTPGSVKRFYNRVNPRSGLIVETELWPNLLDSAHRRSIPLLLANARLSEKSYKGYRRFQTLTKVALKAISHICVQHQADADRFAKLDIDASRISIGGSIKYDMKVPDAQVAKGRLWREALGVSRPVVIAASTHAGEDEIVLDAWKSARHSLANLALVLVPRHPERFESVAALSKRYSDAVSKRSEGIPNHDTQIWIGDSLGEMIAYYEMADIAFVGGSFSGTGGHNPLEPAALCKPVIMGPSRFNFDVICSQLEDAGALCTASDATDLAKLMQSKLVDNQPSCAGLAVVERNKGALERLLKQVKVHLL